MTMQNEQQAAPAPEGAQSTEQTEETTEIRHPDAYARAQSEKFARLSQRLEEAESRLAAYAAQKAEAEEAEALKRGEFEQVISGLKNRESELLGRLRRKSAEAAVARAGITDPELVSMATLDVLANVEDDDASAFFRRAKKLAGKLVPQEPEQPSRVVGAPPAASANPPRKDEPWEEKLRRQANEMRGR